MKKFYHMSPNEIEPGSILRSMRTDKIFLNIIPKSVEHFLESIRQKEFSDRPSRMNSIYVCENPKDYNRNNYLGSNLNIYSVTIDPNAKIHCADDTFSRLLIGKGYYCDQYLVTLWKDEIIHPKVLEVIDSARKYWNGDISIDHRMETLIEGTVKVIKKESHDKRRN